MNQVSPQRTETGPYYGVSLGKEQFALALALIAGVLTAIGGYEWATSCPLQTHWEGVVFGLIGAGVTGMAVYAGIDTAWLTKPATNPLAIVAGAIAISVGLVLLGLLLLSLFVGSAGGSCN